MKYSLLALLSGLFLALGWPTYGFPILLFFGFVPLLLSEHQLRTAKGKSSWKILGLSYITFVIWNFITTNWLWYADPFGASFAILVNSLLMAILFVIYHKLAAKTTLNKALIGLVSLWLCFEKLHLGWEFSWPWLNLGNGFSEYYKWIQWYEFTGTFGGSLWVWIVNIVLFKGILGYQQTKDKRFISSSLIKSVVLVILPISISLIMYYNYEEQKETVEVIALQPNIDPYSEKYSVSNMEFADLLVDLSEHEIETSTRLLLTPETYFAKNVRLSQFEASRFKYQLDQLLYTYKNLNIVSGISFYKLIHDKDSLTPESNYYKDNLWYNDYNSAILLNGNKTEIYHKSKLVVGVENFPYQEILMPIIGDAMIDLGGTVAMKSTQDYRSVFDLKATEAKLAPIICYESVYGEFVTEYVRNGANLLGIITNDAWWDTTQGHKQHLSYARLRAIENRRSVVRSANTGISALINERGDITSSLPYGEQGVLKGKVALNETLTVYTKIGDVISRIALFLALFILLISFFRKPKV
ncbi:MAG: apolipoprotein N-acyltransferase [Bacteroidetes bacterium MedPE-SWsnd-G2]|nr:MAG: apolipoprotein N-acyltransferase [Bacteroidetes bacterium MedPE-SWsnd-G2]